jgi:hypothetical protein
VCCECVFVCAGDCFVPPSRRIQYARTCPSASCARRLCCPPTTLCKESQATVGQSEAGHAAAATQLALCFVCPGLRVKARTLSCCQLLLGGAGAPLWKTKLRISAHGAAEGRGAAEAGRSWWPASTARLQSLAATASRGTDTSTTTAEILTDRRGVQSCERRRLDSRV